MFPTLVYVTPDGSWLKVADRPQHGGLGPSHSEVLHPWTLATGDEPVPPEGGPARGHPASYCQRRRLCSSLSPPRVSPEGCRRGRGRGFRISPCPPLDA